MSEPRYLVGWLMLGVLTVAGAGGAVLGVAQAPVQASLTQAVANTLAATSYREMVVETASAGSESIDLSYQSPDRLGGYVESAKKRSYIYVIGKLQYQSTTVSSSAGTKHLVIYKAKSPGAKKVDPARKFLGYVKSAKDIRHSDGNYTFTVTQNGQVGRFTATVSGQYVSAMTLKVTGQVSRMTITDVGTAPTVALPAGATIK